MAEFVAIGDVGEVPEGGARPFEASGQPIAVARVGGALYAFSDVCTHRGCLLAAGGEVEGTTISCECHGSVFSMETGAPVEGPATEPLATFPVREADGRIEVEV